MKAIVLALVAACACFGQEPMSKTQLFKRFVVTTTDAYFVAPPHLILGEGVGGMEFTPDGRFAVVTGATKPLVAASDYLGQALNSAPNQVSMKPYIKVWDIKNNSVRDLPLNFLKTLMGGDGRFEESYAAAPSVEVGGQEREDFEVSSFSGQIQWTCQPGVGIVCDYSPDPKDRNKVTRTVVKINLANASLTTIRTTSVTDAEDLLVSPTKPIYVEIASQRNRPIDATGLKTDVTYSIFDLSGKPMKSGKASFKGSATFYDWTSDGANVIGALRSLKAVGAKPTTTKLVINTTTGELNETQETLHSYQEDLPKPGIGLAVTASEAKLNKSSKSFNSLWIRSSSVSDQPPVLLSPSVTGQVWMANDCTTVAYVTEGQLFACDVAKVGLDAFLKAKAAAQIEIATSNAKQVALGVMIYSTDCDDFAPLQDGFQDSIYPYVKNRDVLEGFVYTFKGGSLSDVKDPASTEMGYIAVPGGRVVAYVDSHVKFVPNP